MVDVVEAVAQKIEEQHPRVTVLGAAMLDRWVTGRVERLSREAPVPVVHVQEEQFALGGAANVVANVVALGASCDVIGFVGGDPGGQAIRASLESLDGGAVRPMLVERSDRPTTTKTRVMARKQQVVRFDREEKPGVSNLLAIYAALSGQSIEAVANEYDGRGYGDLKKGLAEVVIGEFEPVRARALEMLADPAELDRLLAANAQRASEVAEATLASAYERVGFLRRVRL